MQLNPYRTFDGKCEAAFKFYAKVLGGKIEAMMHFKGTPAEQHMPSGWGKKVLHTSLRVGENVLMGSDTNPDQHEPVKGISVVLVFKDVERRRTRIQGSVGQGQGGDAFPGDLLVSRFRHAG